MAKKHAGHCGCFLRNHIYTCWVANKLAGGDGCFSRTHASWVAKKHVVGVVAFGEFMHGGMLGGKEAYWLLLLLLNNSCLLGGKEACGWGGCL